MSEGQQGRTTQKPIQEWLVLTEFGVELQPLGQRGLVDQMAEAIRPHRRRTTVVTKTAYEKAYGGNNAN